MDIFLKKKLCSISLVYLFKNNSQLYWLMDFTSNECEKLHFDCTCTLFLCSHDEFIWWELEWNFREGCYNRTRLICYDLPSLRNALFYKKEISMLLSVLLLLQVWVHMGKLSRRKKYNYYSVFILFDLIQKKKRSLILLLYLYKNNSQIYWLTGFQLLWGW